MAKKLSFGMFLVIVGVGIALLSGNSGGRSTGTPSPAAPDPHSFRRGERVTIQSDFFGCREPTQEEKVVSLIKANDKMALISYFQEHIGGCDNVTTGDHATVEDVDVWKGLTCVRRVGEPECLWLMTGMMERG